MDQRPDSGRAITSSHRPISSWSVLVAAASSKSVGLRREWRELLDASDDPFAFYQSPEWFDHMREVQGSTSSANFLAIRRDAHQGLVAIVPLFVTSERCRFPLVRGRSYWTRPITMIKIMSGRLLIRPGTERVIGPFDAVYKRYPGLPIRISSVPVDGPLYNYLHSSKIINDRYIICQVPGLEHVHVIPLPPTYAQFLERYTAKKRYNLRRQIRLLSERTGGKINWREYKSSGDVPELRQSFAELLRKRGRLRDRGGDVVELSWPESQYNSLARMDLLRSFVLKDGDRPVCCILGYQFDNTFLAGQTIYDPEYAAYSPGAALLHIVVEALIGEKSVTAINLGYGDPQAEYRSTNVVLDYASYWLFPRTFRNRSISAGYHALKRSVAALKRVRSLVVAKR
jgi:CelD/BcsL family acetyltransferase involved in cellulose biosynthesis